MNMMKFLMVCFDLSLMISYIATTPATVPSSPATTTTLASSSSPPSTTSLLSFTTSTCSRKQVCIPVNSCNRRPRKAKSQKSKATIFCREDESMVCCPKSQRSRCPALSSEEYSFCSVKWIRGDRVCRLTCEEDDHSGFTVGQIFKRDCPRGSVWSRKQDKCARNALG